MLTTGANDGAEFHGSLTEKVSSALKHSTHTIIALDSVPCVAPHVEEHKHCQPPLRLCLVTCPLTFTFCCRCVPKGSDNQIM